MCSSCMCVLNMCFAACSGLGDTHPPTRLETTYACGIINSSSTASLRWICTQVPIFTFVGGFYLSKCSFSIGFFKAADIVSEFYLNSLWVQQSYGNQSELYLNSLWVQQSYGNQSKCWNVQPSCSSHHVECTKTWMRDVSSVLWGDRTLFLKLDSQPTLVLPNIRNKNRATVADDRARCDTPKNLCIVLILPLAALRISYGKRISSDACLYTAFKWNNCSQ